MNAVVAKALENLPFAQSVVNLFRLLPGLPSPSTTRSLSAQASLSHEHRATRNVPLHPHACSESTEP